MKLTFMKNGFRLEERLPPRDVWNQSECLSCVYEVLRFCRRRHREAGRSEAAGKNRYAAIFQMTRTGHRPRDVRDVGSPHVDPNQCASVVEEDLARRLFRL